MRQNFNKVQQIILLQSVTACCLQSAISIKPRANACNNMQHCWTNIVVYSDEHTTGQKYPQFHANHWIRRVERMRRCNIVGCIVQTHATLLCYASMIAKQKKCWMLLHLKFDQFQTSCNNIQQVATTRNNMQHGVQTIATCCIEQCCMFLHNNVALVCTGL